MHRGLLKALGLFAVVTMGCGPILYTAAINDAAEAVEEARALGAGNTPTGEAAYEYWRAVEHLNKAREFAGEAEYQAAVDMADTAAEAGHRARTLARQQQQHDAP